MEFTFEMDYSLRAMTIMAKGIRKALQADRDKKSRIIGWIVVAACLLILLTIQSFDYRHIITIIALCLFVVYLLFPDHVYGLWASWQIPVKMRKGTWTFREDGFFSTTELGISGFDYDTIHAMIELEGYLVVCFANSQGQIFNVSKLPAGDIANFRRLLRKKTSITIQEV